MIPYLEKGISHVFSVQELKVPKVSYLKMGGSNGFRLGTEDSDGSLFRNGWFQWYSVQELKAPMVPYLEMDNCLGTEGSKGSLFRNMWFQCFPVQELKVPKVPRSEERRVGKECRSRWSPYH